MTTGPRPRLPAPLRAARSGTVTRSSAAEREDRSMSVYTYDPPDRFVAGAVGQPGERAFYLQATGAGRVTSVALEKFQVRLLAERLDQLLDEVLRRTGGRGAAPAPGPAELGGDGPPRRPALAGVRGGATALASGGGDERAGSGAQ